MEIDNIKLKQYYKDIHKTCIQKGELIPLLLDRPIKDSTHLTLQEIQDTRKQVHSDELEKLDKQRQEKYRQRQKDIVQIQRNPKSQPSTIKEYMEDELKTFIDNYPQFKEIVETW